jgi:hypothetical protein
MSAESKNGVQFAVDHWIAIADTLKQQRDQAEKERDALRKDADIVRRARGRFSLVIEVTPELLTKDAFTAQPLHVMLTDNGDGTHLLTFRESDKLHTLRAERDALRKDAARYRLLRGLFRHAKWADVDALHELEPDGEKYIADDLLDAALDCVIDAAMEAKP